MLITVSNFCLLLTSCELLRHALVTGYHRILKCLSIHPFCDSNYCHAKSGDTESMETGIAVSNDTQSGEWWQSPTMEYLLRENLVERETTNNQTTYDFQIKRCSTWDINCGTITINKHPHKNTGWWATTPHMKQVPWTFGKVATTTQKIT